MPQQSPLTQATRVLGSAIVHLAPRAGAESAAVAGFSRIILHADMDAFYASVEELDDPSLRGKPLIIAFDSPRSVVSTASYAARPFGVHSAMPLAQAKRLCPQGLIVPPRFERYQEISATIMEVFESFSPLVEALSLDEAFLDMTGSERLLGTPRRMGEKLKAAVREATGGLTVSVGIASTKYVAKVASDFQKPDGLTLVTDAERDTFLHPLPVRRLWGVGEKTVPSLERLGLRSIGDVARTERQWLLERLGNLGAHIHDLAHGLDPRPVEAGHAQKSIGHEETLERDIRGQAGCKPILLRAADRVAERLRKEQLLARGLRVKLKTASFQLMTRQALLPSPSDSADPLYAAALVLLDEFDWNEPLRLVGLAAYGLEGERAGQQGELFDGGKSLRRARLDRAVDGVRARIGRDALKRASELDGPAESPRYDDKPRRR